MISIRKLGSGEAVQNSVSANIFLQADPFIEDTGTLNRYTYVHNNPLAYTDPSGFFGIKDFLKIAAVAVVSFYTAGAANAALAASKIGSAFVIAAMGGSVAGFISAGSVEGALWGAFSGAAFLGVGQAFGGSEALGEGILGSTFKNAGELARASLAHGIAGGTISAMQGGRFGHGFLSAGVSKAATPAAVGFSDNELVQGVLVTVVGGTTSEISGGKFAKEIGVRSKEIGVRSCNVHNSLFFDMLVPWLVR